MKTIIALGFLALASACSILGKITLGEYLITVVLLNIMIWMKGE